MKRLEENTGCFAVKRFADKMIFSTHRKRLFNSASDKKYLRRKATWTGNQTLTIPRNGNISTTSIRSPKALERNTNIAFCYVKIKYKLRLFGHKFADLY